MSQDELQTAIRVSRSTYEKETQTMDDRFVMLGALLRAVEILAERHDKPSEADSGIIAKLEQKIKIQHAQIGELEKEVARQRGVIRMQNNASGQTTTDLDNLAKRLVPIFEQAYKDGPNNQLLSVRAGIRAVLAACPLLVADSAAPVDANGKTPGVLARDVFCRDIPDLDSRVIGGGAEISWERAAQAVLRAFGNRTQPATNDAVEALRRVRERIANNPYPDVRALRHVDAEIAKLEAKPAPVSDHVHSPSWPCSICDKPPLDTSTESGLPDAVLQEKL